MPKLLFSVPALADLEEIHDYIARDKPVAARKWIDRINEKCALIAAFPNAGERRPDLGPTARLTTIGNYVIIYRHSEDAVIIARVRRAGQDVLFTD